MIYKIYYLFILIIIIGASCKKLPEANFEASKTDVYPSDTVFFTNTSIDAYSFVWNFGDGNTSTEVEPKHAYNELGKYIVSLEAFSKNEKKSDKKSVEITVHKANEILYDGKRYSLNKGYIENMGTTSGVFYDYNLYLVDNSINISKQSISGVGNVIYIYLWSSLQDGLSSGKINFSDSQNNDTFSFAYLGLDYDIENDEGYFVECTGGYVNISREGNNYIIEINFDLSNGKKLHAYYKGRLTFYDKSN